MSVSIIFAYSDEAKEKALAAGFREKVCLVRYETATGQMAEEKTATEISKFGHGSWIGSQSYWGTSID